MSQAMRRVGALALLVSMIPDGAWSQATLSEYQGGVQVRRAAAAAAEAVTSAPLALRMGDEVRTGIGASAQVRLEDGSQVRLTANAVFILEESGPRRISLRLDIGRLRAVVTRKRRRVFEIRTPTAVASVRGTVFEVHARGEQGTEVNVES